MYGGALPGFVALAVIQISRFIIGVNLSSFVSFGLLSTLYIGYLLLRRWKAEIVIKAFTMLLYSNMIFSFIIVYTLLKITTLTNEINLLYWIASIVTGLMAIYTTEHLRKMNDLFIQYKQSATIDPLTGLNNVRSFDEALNAAIQDTFSSKQKPLSLLVVDIDFFKHVNDTYGHPAGDSVLQQFGLILRNAARMEDIVSRNGGEEFTLLLRNCPHSEALEMAEKLRSSIEKKTFGVKQGGDLYITASIGVSTYPETVASSEYLYSEADQALYKAKRTGRNRVCSNETQIKAKELQKEGI